ncbi:MAG: signal peptidase I [Arenicellales bacterium]
MKNTTVSDFKNLWQENRHFAVFLVLMFCFRSAVADWNEVPTGSMQPTIVEGDRILVNKLAYDIRVPFTHLSVLNISEPKRGDIIIFDSKAADKRLVKRVIGLPGDTIQMENNQLTINRQPLSYQNINEQDSNENLLGVRHRIRTRPFSAYATFKATQVPQGHYLVLGDNRDNSADSRMIGFVPRKEIIGRTQRVVMSLNYDKHYLPRSERFLKVL